MKPNPLFSLISGLGALSAASLLITGCQSEAPVSPASPSLPQAEYTSSVLKLKAGAAPDYDQALSKLNSRFSVPAADAPAEIPANTGGVAKSAAVASMQGSFTATRINKFVFKAIAGSIAEISARVSDIGRVNPADPMIELIQFNDPDFINNGTLNNYGQQGFRIVALDDDGGGGLSSHLSHTFTSGEVGYYMWLILPYSSSASTGQIDISFDLIHPPCGCNVDYVFKNPYTLGGAIFRYNGIAGSSFQAIRSGALSDPHLYVFKNGSNIGMANGDANGTVNSEVTAFPVTDSDTNNPYNFVLIDNDRAGITGQGTFLAQ